MFGADSALASSPKTNSASWSLQHNIEVHTENTSEGVILNTQIDVFLDTETKASSIGEVSLLELSVLDFKTSFQDLISLVTTDGDMNGNLFVSFNTEASDCESSSRRNWLLPSQIFKHFAS